MFGFSKRIQWIVLLCVALIVGSPAEAQDSGSYVHEATGVTIPSEVHGFRRDSVVNHETNTPGQGVGIGFSSGTSYKATLFIYTNGLASVPTDVNDPIIQQVRSEAVAVVLLAAKTREPKEISANSRKAFSETTAVSTEPEKTKMLWDSFVVYLGGRATNDDMYIWPAKGQIFKLRVTRIPGQNDNVDQTSQVTAFVNSLVRYSVGQAAK